MPRLRHFLPLVVVALSASVTPAFAQPPAWQPKTPPLSTPWTAQVGPANALPEYPRPQLVRPDWQNLNGVWQFAPAAAGAAPPFGQNLAQSILVPFPIESALSGIAAHSDRMWYRRTFTVPAGWAGRRVQLNFGAVNWQADVWVNGVRVGGHTGGYGKFSFDITPRLSTGANELIVGVFAPIDSGGQPVGKQRRNPGGIFYTAASGIWQTVWLEPTASAWVTRLDVTPDLPGNRVRVIVRAAGTTGATATVTVRTGGTVISRGTGAVNAEIALPVPNARRWSPDDPFLYDLDVALTGGDAVTSYFGMRSVGKAMVNGVLRPVLNGQFVFHVGTLDQGYWPDGIYTAPTDAALRFDLQAHKDLGFNTVRKHIKVEPDRWFHWADRLGLLVWQDMPSMTTGRNPDAAARANFEAELREMIDQHRSVTSIVQWVPFNEGWGEYDPARIADLVKAMDPTRLVDNNSGSNCCGFDGGNGDTVDDHIYVGPGNPQRPSATRVAQLGEFGGLGLRVPGHEWSPGNGFGVEMVPNGTVLTDRYVSLIAGVQRLVSRTGLSAAIYTQITDVENEVNGFYTYDRAVLKTNAAAVRAANRALLTGARVLPAAPLPVNTRISLRVTTPGFTDRYVRHQNALAFTEHVDAGSAALLKADATWRITTGLADPTCYSFESVNFPGEYLRHANSRVRKDGNDGSDLYRRDATWCSRPGLTGSNVALDSLDFPGKFLRHFNAELWLAANGGPNTYESAVGFPADVTWQISPPWVP
ncbi:MAG TPA: AbfB domain-containing protein [Actinophytocola sp.]|uniref:AbfB domain-containing protein n=1 Tax=Actinophytocola sp. TaxID=1872138 RepID=UPI002DBFF9CD|nr:AbfB domain-containing protein [Actinophytocola sp.]HEU5471949.1 AbfB domain-containing protein [Actinophytocola sp.]